MSKTSGTPAGTVDEAARTEWRIDKKFGDHALFPGNGGTLRLQQGMNQNSRAFALDAPPVTNLNQEWDAMNRHIRRLLAKMAIAATIIFEVLRRGLKGRHRTARSTKPADGLTLVAFDLACSKRLTFREARQELERRSVAAHLSAVDTRGNRDQVPIPKQSPTAVFNPLRHR